MWRLLCFVTILVWSCVDLQPTPQAFEDITTANSSEDNVTTPAPTTQKSTTTVRDISKSDDHFEVLDSNQIMSIVLLTLMGIGLLVIVVCGIAFRITSKDETPQATELHNMEQDPNEAVSGRRPKLADIYTAHTEEIYAMKSAMRQKGKKKRDPGNISFEDMEVAEISRDARRKRRRPSEKNNEHPGDKRQLYNSGVLMDTSRRHSKDDLSGTDGGSAHDLSDPGRRKRDKKRDRDGHEKRRSEAREKGNYPDERPLKSHSRRESKPGESKPGVSDEPKRRRKSHGGRPPTTSKRDGDPEKDSDQPMRQDDAKRKKRGSRKDSKTKIADVGEDEQNERPLWVEVQIQPGKEGRRHSRDARREGTKKGNQY